MKEEELMKKKVQEILHYGKHLHHKMVMFHGTVALVKEDQVGILNVQQCVINY